MAGPVNPSAVPLTPDLKSVKRCQYFPSGETAYMLVHTPFWRCLSVYFLLNPKSGGGEYLSRSTAMKIHLPEGCHFVCIFMRLRLGPLRMSAQVMQASPELPFCPI